MTAGSDEFMAGIRKICDNPDALISFFDQNAHLYDQVIAEIGDNSIIIHCAETLKQFMGETYMQKEILDVGCGSGVSGECLKKAGFRGNIDGVDLSQGMLERANNLSVYRELQIGKITDDEKLNFNDGCYDAIFCIGAIGGGYISIKNTIPEFLRLLRKGGIAVYTISHSVEKGVALREHISYISYGKIELKKTERRFYHLVEGEPTFGHIYVIKKL